MALVDNELIVANGAASGGEQAMKSVGALQTFSSGTPASDTQTNGSDVVLLSTDVDLSLGLTTTFFDVVIDDIFLLSSHFVDVVGSNANSKFQLILKETVSNTVISDEIISIGNVAMPLNTGMLASATGSEPSASISLLATGITGTITFTNTVTAAKMTLARSRPFDFQAVAP